ncbi:hypothetical protein IB238_12305 [Rhizobium sp. ARZ01]|uniref:hypothetical protein n=1 Tax=Rhizobium sp. ARZ01 TaxID=2769313 RepID=UPI001784AD19|nr:hypothetical protein [Rhizobium sp. ARZ01]MBD9373402.1 hypothetical protein [Rhizobium sp. ARZ01]
MADFVAVIRRAVDGLTDNSPDMRVKVYDKARGAVRRQLEAMNPRPSDELVQRQLDKLENAISEVEGEHAEALPAEKVSVEESAPAVVKTPPVPEPVQVLEPPPEHVTASEVPEREVMQEPTAVPEPVQDVIESAPVASEPTEPEPEVQQHWTPEAAELPPAVAPAHDETAHPDAAAAADHDQGPSYIGLEPVEDPANDHTAFAEQATASHYGEPAAAHDVHAIESVTPPEAAAEAPATAKAMPWEWSDEPADAEPDEVTAHEVIAREEQTRDVAPHEVAAETAPEWSWPEEATTGAPAPEQKKAKDNAWSDLEDLIGYQPSSNAAATPAASADALGAAGATETAVRNGQRPFRAEPRKRKISFAKIGATVAALAVIGGAGAAYWLNRDTVDGMIADLVAPAATPAGDTGGTNGDAGAVATGNGQGEAAGTRVASAESGKTKFTQRLLPDGTESDDGPAVVAGDATAEEGKSVAEQTTEVASAETIGTATGIPAAGGTATATDGAANVGTPVTGATTEAAAGQATAGAAAGVAPTGTAQTTTTAEQPPVGVSQKMFLYEERLGQSAPTAIDGTVVWSKAEESPGGDAKPEPVIRAQVNAPSNGLTAQLTIRRNADKSLPASHLVEIVFALPPNFEGGNIDSVQRVAMKQTEQDRGDPLIAVPAKITEDFHMIALNDFPDAITRNAELLKSRDWIDIPITYRNGRRALITLEKGTTGAEVFNSVMSAWATLAPTANSQ